jgi:hypothetical protein
MKRIARSALLLSGLLLAVQAAPASAAVAVSIGVSYFHDSLAPYGEWIHSARYGDCWAPRRVSHDWRPYTHGHWIYTEYDWTWVSDEEWGWATDHYGRWAYDPVEGWIWVPGDQWAPAWVAWRYRDDYVGWAPLPPEADPFRVSVGLGLPSFAFSFVETRHFCDNDVHRYVAPVARNVTIVRVTRDTTRYALAGGRVVNRGVDVQRVERVAHSAVPRALVQEVHSPTQARGAHPRAGTVAVFRPPVTASTRAPEPVVTGKAHAEERSEAAQRRMDNERRDLSRAEERERQQLRKVQERDLKKPSAMSQVEARSAPAHPEPHAKPQSPVARPDVEVRARAQQQADARAREQASARTKAQQRQQAEARERDGAAQRARASERAAAELQQVRERHDTEMKAQAEHEQRERRALQQRQAREQRQRAAAQRQAQEQRVRQAEAQQRERQQATRNRNAEARQPQSQPKKAQPQRPAPKPQKDDGAGDH